MRAARHAAEKKGVSSAIQRTTRQSPYKMRLVIDQIRGKDVNEALGLLRFSKKHAAKQIEKVLNSAVANAEFKSREGNESIDVDTLYIKHAIVNEGPALRRFMPAAQGRATPIRKRTSHVEIVLDAREEKLRAARSTRGAERSTTQIRAARSARGAERSTAEGAKSSGGKR
ncbi:MAG: 50S ribosomal protein L22 [Gemmatimonadetes bacterium 13_1_40CM_2_60_3]|nr:MAG: 50S ribosomal protein L22 [Gemmatimonadetes bacterium 13_1_40CM_2_60_3]